jgi:hypothetical protein
LALVFLLLLLFIIGLLQFLQSQSLASRFEWLNDSWNILLSDVTNIFKKIGVSLEDWAAELIVLAGAGAAIAVTIGVMRQFRIRGRSQPAWKGGKMGKTENKSKNEPLQKNQRTEKTATSPETETFSSAFLAQIDRVNTSFTSLYQAKTDLDPKRPLKPNTPYYFTFSVSERLGNLEKPKLKNLDLSPNQNHLKVVLFGFENELEITPKKDIGEIQIMPDWSVKVTQRVDKPSSISLDSDLLNGRLFFPVRTPKKEGEFRLRCNLYCKQTLIQSRLIEARISHKIARLDFPAINDSIEYSINKSLNPELLADLEPKTLSIMVNENDKGTHCFRLFAKDPQRENVEECKYEKTFNVETLESLIKNARQALRFAYWGTEKDWEEGSPLKYQGKLNFDTLTKDLILLAKSGAQFWLKLTQKAAPEGNQYAFSDMMLQPTSLEFVIKDPSSAASYMFPASLIYDYSLLTNLDAKEYSLCPSFKEAITNEIPLEDTRCFKGDCPSRNDPSLKVVCPSGFWGFRHSIGVPLGSPTDRSQKMVYKEYPEITASAYPSFSTWPSHQKALKSIGNWQFEETVPDTFKQLVSKDSHIVYFYCHGGYHKDTPYIKIGAKDDPEISPTDLIQPFRPTRKKWMNPRPIVFMNGCHTVGMDPKLILDFPSTFVVSLNAIGVMGTEISIFESLACAFAEEWLTHFLVKGESAGEATLKTRLNLLQKGNPLGLIYSLYADAHLRLEKAN